MMTKSNNVSEFGKELRILRIQNNEKMRDMAAKINVSTAYLSAVELGHKPVTDKMLENVTVQYELPFEQLTRMKKLSVDSKNEFKIKANGYLERQLLNLIDEKLNNLTNKQLEHLIDVIEKIGNKHE